MNSDYLDKLKAWGLDWGQGDSRNPEECRNRKGGQHTNCVRTWLKHKNNWYVYQKCGLLRLLDSFTQCESQEDVDLIVQIMINDHLLDNYD